MIDSQTIWGIFYHYRHNIGLGLVSALMCALRHIQIRDNWRNTFTSAIMCGLVSFGIDEGLTEWFGLSGKSTYLVATFIGYIGISVLFKRIDWLSETSKENN